MSKVNFLDRYNQQTLDVARRVFIWRCTAIPATLLMKIFYLHIMFELKTIHFTGYVFK